MSTTTTGRKRARRTLGEPEGGGGGNAGGTAGGSSGALLDGGDLDALRGEIDERLSRLESRIESRATGGGEAESEERRVYTRGGDAELVREEIKRAIDEFERRNMGELRDARSRRDRQRTGLLERVGDYLVGAAEMASPEKWKETWARYSLRGKSEIVDDYGMDPVVSQRFKPLMDFLFYEYWRVDVIGIENVPAEGPGLLVSNHSGGLPYDGAMIKAAVMNEQAAARDVRFLVEDFAYHFPFLGTMMMRIGGVRASPENATRLLRKGELVCVFPEGVKGLGKLYKHRYRLQRFGRGGFVKICLDTKSPLIPVAVVGAEEIHPMIGRGSWIAEPMGVPYFPVTPIFPWLGILGLIPLPSKWTIKIGTPIDFKEFSDDARKNRILINKLSQQVRGQIQDMIIDQLKSRRSIWFG